MRTILILGLTLLAACKLDVNVNKGGGGGGEAAVGAPAAAVEQVVSMACNNEYSWVMKPGSKIGNKTVDGPTSTEYANVRDKDNCEFELNRCPGQSYELGKDIEEKKTVRVMGNRNSTECAEPGYYQCTLEYNNETNPDEIFLKSCIPSSGQQGYLLQNLTMRFRRNYN